LDDFKFVFVLRGSGEYVDSFIAKRVLRYEKLEAEGITANTGEVKFVFLLVSFSPVVVPLSELLNKVSKMKSTFSRTWKINVPCDFILILCVVIIYEIMGTYNDRGRNKDSIFKETKSMKTDFHFLFEFQIILWNSSVQIQR